MQEEDEEVNLSRFLPKKATKWIWPIIAMDVAIGFGQTIIRSLEDVQTVFCQRNQYEDEKKNFLSDLDRDLEMLNTEEGMASMSAGLFDDEDEDEDEE